MHEHEEFKLTPPAPNDSQPPETLTTDLPEPIDPKIQPQLPFDEG